MLTGILLSRLFMAVKITSQHAVDLKCREFQFESDLATQAARFEEDKHALTQRFKNEMCDLRKVLLFNYHIFYGLLRSMRSWWRMPTLS